MLFTLSSFPILLTAYFLPVSLPPRSLVLSLFPHLLYSLPCNDRTSRSSGAETLDRSAVVTELGAPSIPFPKEDILVQGLESSETFSLVGNLKLTLRYSYVCLYDFVTPWVQLLL